MKSTNLDEAVSAAGNGTDRHGTRAEADSTGKPEGSQRGVLVREVEK